MSRIGAFSRHELQSLLWRSGGIVLASLTSLLAVRILIHRDPAGAGGMLALIGWIAFLPLLTFGYGRPVYSIVRVQVAHGMDASRAVRQHARRFAVFALVSLVLYACLGPWLAMRQGATGSSAEVALFAAGLVAVASGCFTRDLSYAVSLEGRFERSELIRKVVALAAYGLLGLGLPIGLTGLCMLLGGVASHIDLGLRFFRAAGKATSSDIAVGNLDRPSQLASDARRYMAFSASETALYNLPLLFFTLFAGAEELVYFGIWSRLFQLIVLPMRVLIDARVNRQTAAHFLGDVHQLRLELATSQRISLLAVTGAMAIAAMTLSPVLRWMGAGVFIADKWFLPSLVIWGLGNAIQHVYGSFVLSYGGGFGFAMRVSVLSLPALALAFAATYSATASQGQALTSAGLLYCVFTLFYRRHALHCARRTGEAS